MLIIVTLKVFFNKFILPREIEAFKENPNIRNSLIVLVLKQNHFKIE